MKRHSKWRSPSQKATAAPFPPTSHNRQIQTQKAGHGRLGPQGPRGGRGLEWLITGLEFLLGMLNFLKLGCGNSRTTLNTLKNHFKWVDFVIWEIPQLRKRAASGKVVQRARGSYFLLILERGKARKRTSIVVPPAHALIG